MKDIRIFPLLSSEHFSRHTGMYRLRTRLHDRQYQQTALQEEHSALRNAQQNHFRKWKAEGGHGSQSLLNTECIFLIAPIKSMFIFMISGLLSASSIGHQLQESMNQVCFCGLL